MKILQTVLLPVIIAGLMVISSSAFAACTFNININNKGSKLFKVEKIKQRVPPNMLYTTKWQGLESVAPGATEEFKWGDNTSCENRYLKVIMQDGTSCKSNQPKPDSGQMGIKKSNC